MKLRNKKTGEVIEVEIVARNDKYLIDRVVDTIYENEPTLKGLSEEWEDA